MTDHRRIAGFRKLPLLCLPLVLGCGVSLTDGLPQSAQRESSPRVVLTGSASARPNSAVSPPTITSIAKAPAIDQFAQRGAFERGQNASSAALPPSVESLGQRHEIMETPPTDRSAGGESDSLEAPSPEVASVDESSLASMQQEDVAPPKVYELAGKLNDILVSAAEIAVTPKGNESSAEPAPSTSVDDLAESALAAADVTKPNNEPTSPESTFVHTRNVPAQGSSGPVAVLTMPTGGDDHTAGKNPGSMAAIPEQAEPSPTEVESKVAAEKTVAEPSVATTPNSANEHQSTQAPAPVESIAAIPNQPPMVEAERLPVVTPAAAPPDMVATTPAPPVSAAIGPIPLPRQIAPPAPGRFTPAEATRARRSEMLAVARLADAHTRQAFDLAGRNALFTARTEFIAALSMVAQGLDSIERGSAHIDAMYDGLRALEESNDFISTASQTDTGMDAVTLSRPHKTPVLKGYEPGSVTIMEALQAYYGFAQQRFVFAADHEPAASAALHGLGKLHTVLGRTKAPHAVASEPKGIVFQQAALLVDPRNFMASNELGVLLSNYGKYDQAKAALLQSVMVSGQPITWRNLSAVHAHLGETRLAQLAQREAEMGTQRGVDRTQVGPSGVPITAFDIRWVDKDTLAQVRESTPSMAKPVPSVVAAPSSPTIQTSASQKR